MSELGCDKKPFISNEVQLNILHDGAVAYGCSFSVEDFHNGLYGYFSISLGVHLISAVSKRRAEYLAGRYLASKCLTVMGKEGFDLIPDDKNCPIWPNGVTGSISHTNNYAVAICMRKVKEVILGIDIESLIPMDAIASMKDLVLTASEKYFLNKIFPDWKVNCDQAYKMRVIFTILFSAKESFLRLPIQKLEHISISMRYLWWIMTPRSLVWYFVL